MKRLALAVGLLLSVSSHVLADPLTGSAAQLYAKATRGPHYEQSARLHPRILPTADGRSFAAVWQAVPNPTHWIVSLHGSRGFATDDLAVWHPHLKDRPVGIICLQWWLGENDSTSGYLTPREMYDDLSPLLGQLKVTPGKVMLEGFSRGSANSYALAAIDAGDKGHHWFNLCVAQCGGASPDYPPTRAIDEGLYGREPLRGTRWVTVAGAKDPNPQRDGLEGMRQTARWLEAHGATVLARIEDPSLGHGAMHLSQSNTKRVLDLFLR